MRIVLLVLLAWPLPARANGWTDVPALIASATAPIAAEVRTCSKLPKRVAIIATRGKDGTRVAMPMPPVGHRGFTREERCLMAAIARIELPALPAEVDRVVLGHTFGAADPAFVDWRDLPAALAALVDPTRRAGLAACDRKPRTVRVVLDLRRGATRAWLPAWQFHAKTGDGSTPAPERRVKACLTNALRGWTPPVLPAGMPELELALAAAP